MSQEIKTSYAFTLLLVIFFSFLTLTSWSTRQLDLISDISPLSQLAQVGGGTTYYVAISGDDANSGTQNLPWKTVEHALDTIQSGDTLYLRDGLYRYDEGKHNSPGSLGNRQLNGVTISSYPGERATIYLSARVDSGWLPYEREGANIWYIDWRTYAETNHSWLSTHGDIIDYYSVHPGALIPHIAAIDGGRPTLLQQVNVEKLIRPPTEMESLRTNQDDMESGDFYYESTEGDPEYGMLFVWLPDGSEPNGQPLEFGISRGLRFSSQNNLTISGITLRYGNLAALIIEGNDTVLDDIDTSYNAGAGLNGICNSCVIKNSTLSFNGNSGSGLFGANILYEDNTFEGNNFRRFSQNYHCGGMKLITNPSEPGMHAPRMTIRGNTFKNTVGCRDLWLDSIPDGGHIIEKNTFISDNPLFGGLFLEAVTGSANEPVIVRNNIFDGAIDVYISRSSYMYVLNNLFTAGRGVTMHGIEGCSPGGNTLAHNKFLNNIVYGKNISNIAPIPVFIVQGAPAPCTVTDNISDYNLIFTPPGDRVVFGGQYPWENGITWQGWQALGYDAHTTTSDPLFVNYSGGNWRLQDTSPAIGAGQITPYVTDDFQGKSRNGRNDIGPYQSDVTTEPLEPAPTISSVQTTPSMTTVSISWTTNVPTDGQIEYGLTANYGSNTALNTTLSTSHLETITGLTAKTLYHFRVKSKTILGTPVASIDRTFTTTAIPVLDTISPSVSMTSPVAGASVTAGSVSLRANASDNIGVVGVQFYLNNTARGSEDTSASYSATVTLTPGTYSAYARARDEAGNTATSNTVSFTVTAENILPLPLPPSLENIPGCDNRTTGFSTTTGKSCIGNIVTERTYNFGIATLRVGSRGEAVRELQRFLNDTLNLGLVVDGILGGKTVAIVKTWQASNDLVPDGLVGARTKAKMNGLPPPVGTTSPLPSTTTPPRKEGTEEVKRLQRFLNRVLYRNIPVDGNLGPDTVLLIMRWQLYNDLVVDGVVGPETKAKMKAAGM